MNIPHQQLLPLTQNFFLTCEFQQVHSLAYKLTVELYLFSLLIVVSRHCDISHFSFALTKVGFVRSVNASSVASEMIELNVRYHKVASEDPLTPA